MSGTPKYYFEQRWMGLESLAKIIGDRNFPSGRNSVELSLGDQLQDLVQVIESVLACSSEIRDAIFERVFRQMRYIMKSVCLKDELYKL